ncbi:MAG: DUF2628 domain-containing protein [Gammaproteobacteria bacterium]|nr:DUF2628 domain-containing protein [Gammaproteobacteria bacterium]MBU1491624.1 DUF2628 domain-containing protein [Gammaproteobacteria bacterium]MBU2067170.1 DUF2628 domain-containing protein [Gammaproteobacteria bacterium]MBU2137770.1 DUF2628 domain-containing protein [Gammaproteobacteria bacterium]MBU2217832.1 DUF2628 domain-containing protein [Gammaproteobacteria bacterium]
MTQHNPYATPNASVAEPQAPVSDEQIAALPISDKWKQRFSAIHHAGGVKLPKFKELPKAERRKAFSFNVLAFFFGPIYYAIKGMWKKGLALFVVCAAVVIPLGFGLDYLGYGTIANALGYGISAIFASRANIDYYKKMLLNDNGWW